MSDNVNVTHYTVNNQCRAGTSYLKGAYFVLQLHDELIYETTEQDLIQVGTLFPGSSVPMFVYRMYLMLNDPIGKIFI